MRNIRWSDWIRQALSRQALSRQVAPRRHKTTNRIEQLENRTLLSATSAGTELPPTGGALYFAADDGVHGVELWKSDGTAAGTTLVADINPGEGSSYAGGYTGDGYSPFLFDLNGTLVFLADDGVHGVELWKSDGTTAGTVLLKDTTVFPEGGPLESYGVPRDPVQIGNRVFFTNNDLVHGRELWVTDGTEAGTFLVKDINPGASATAGYGDGSYPSYLFAADGLLYFQADDGVHGTELWRSDGTEAGTFMLGDINPGSGPSYAGGAYGTAFFAAGGLVFFQANDGEHGVELWRTDGTVAGTFMVSDINPGSISSYPGGYSYYGSAGFAFLDGILYYAADDGVHGVELWRSDGTTEGTFLLKDINEGEYSSYAGGDYGNVLAVVNGYLLFVADDGVNGAELWRTDGTVEGTQLLKDINPGSSYTYDYDYGDYTYSPNSSYIGGDYGSVWGVFNGILYFAADDGVHGVELWRSDGTAEGTFLLADILEGTDGSYPGGYGGAYGSGPAFAFMNGILYFTANDGVHGAELWRTDGTVEGTMLVVDINAGEEDGSYPGGYGYYGRSTFVVLDGFLYFPANDGVHGFELWRTDGTAGGTSLVSDIFEGDYDSYPGSEYGGVMIGAALFVNATPDLTDAVFSIAENSAPGSPVGVVTGTDADVGDTLTYSILGGNAAGAFGIDPNTGAITVVNSAALDFETTTSFSLTVQVSDQHGATDTATITINLTNVNETPTMNGGAFVLAENSPAGTSVGTVTGTDPDAGDTLLYSITAGNVGGAFAINAITGEITVANPAAVDFETTPVFTLTVVANDAGLLQSTSVVTIELTDVNDVPALLGAGQSVTFSKKAAKQNGDLTLVPNVVVDDADQSPDFKLGGGTLTLSVDTAFKSSRKGPKFYDTINGLSAATSLGVVTGPTLDGNRQILVIQLSETTTAAAVQAFLRGISFSTTGKGLKQATRTFRAQVSDAAGALSNQLELTVNVTK